MRKKLLIAIPAVLLATAAGIYVYANYQARAIIDTRISALVEDGAYRDLRYDSIRVKINGDIELQNLHVTDEAGNEYILENILVTDMDYRNEIPHHLNFTAEGLSFPAGLPRFGMTLNNSLNNYLASVTENDIIPLVLNYSYVYQPDNGMQLDSRFAFELPDSFNLTSTSVMKNIPLQTMNEETLGPAVYPGMTAAFLEAEIPQASMALQDLGMVNTFMTIQGESRGISSDEYRLDLIEQLQTLHLFAPRQLQNLTREYSDIFIAFLDGDKTLRLSIAPEYGGSISRLQAEVIGSMFIGDFENIVAVLNLEMETL